MEVIIFPYDERAEALIKYTDLLEDISVKMLLSPLGFGVKDVLISGNDTMYTIQSELKEKDILEADALLITESYHEIAFELIYEQVKRITEHDKKIILARTLAPDELNQIERICEERKIQLIQKKNKLNDQVSYDYSSLSEIHTPIIVVMGAGTKCNTFELQLEIRKQLLEQKYRVCSISDRSNCIFQGVHSYPEFMQSTELDEKEKIINYNRFVKYLEETEYPDLFIIGIPDGVMPLTRQKPGGFGVSAYEILNAVEPDFTIMSLYANDYQEEYFDEMSKLLYYRFNIDADCYHISNYSVDKFSLGSIMPIKYLKHEDSEIEERCAQYKHKVYCRRTYSDMIDFLLNTLADYDEMKIL